MDGRLYYLPHMAPATRTPPDVSGQGYLAGDLPDGITKVEGIPTSATIRVHLRRDGLPGDGMLVAETTSAEGGDWLVPHLNPDMKFDVICRYPGYNDMILSNVSPALATGLEFVGSFATLDDQVEILLGVGPYQVDVVDGEIPSGVTFKAGGDYVVATGKPSNWGQFTFTLRVIDSNGLSGVFVSEMVVAEPLPEVIGQEYGGGFYIGNIIIPDGDDAGEYVIIMAGPESQPGTLTWKSPRSATAGTDSTTNGMANTLAMQTNDPVIHYAGLYCLGYNGGGFDDWYLPAKDELNLAWVNLSQLAVLAMDAQFYWSSTQLDANNAWGQNFRPGAQNNSYGSKTSAYRVRPVRRLPFTPETGG